MWTEIYRPTQISDLIGQSEARDLFTGLLALSTLQPNILCHGPAGTGKTSACLAFSKEKNFDILCLNASNENGIDVIREKIKSFVTCHSIVMTSTSSTSTIKNKKAVLLDECDALSDVAQKALRRIMEDYGVCFLLCCNDIERVHPALISRCISISFGPLSKFAIKMICTNILLLEEDKKDNKDKKNDDDTIMIEEKEKEKEKEKDDDFYKGGDARRVINCLQSKCEETKILQYKYDLSNKNKLKRLADLDYMLHTTTSDYVKNAIKKHLEKYDYLF